MTRLPRFVRPRATRAKGIASAVVNNAISTMATKASGETIPAKYSDDRQRRDIFSAGDTEQDQPKSDNDNACKRNVELEVIYSPHDR